MTTSSDLNWMLLKNNNRFLVKRNGVQFSGEANNLTNRNSYKFSGLANARTVGVSVTTAGKDKKQRVQLTVGKGRKQFAQKPSKRFDSIMLRSHMANGTCASAAAIRSLTKKNGVRADLTKYAIARYHAVNRSLKPVVAKKERKPRGSKAIKA